MLFRSSVIKKHAGRNSLNVTLTVVGLTFAGFIAGFPIIEVVFGLNGVGRLLAYSVTIPRRGGAESLNAAVAAAIVCDNLRRAAPRPGKGR